MKRLKKFRDRQKVTLTSPLMQRLLTTILAVRLNGLDSLAWSKMLRSVVSHVKSNRKIFLTTIVKKRANFQVKIQLFLGRCSNRFIKKKISNWTCSPDCDQQVPLSPSKGGHEPRENSNNCMFSISLDLRCLNRFLVLDKKKRTHVTQCFRMKQRAQKHMIGSAHS